MNEELERLAFFVQFFPKAAWFLAIRNDGRFFAQALWLDPNDKYEA